jgi:hypothetical protein
LDQTVTTPVIERISWHPDLHFELHEYVRYYRVRLASRYESDKVFKSFKALCAHWEVGTYSILEVYGSHDLIIRLYSKQSRAFNEAFIKWVKKPVPKTDIKMETELPEDYDTCLYHWLWTNEDGQYERLPSATVKLVASSPKEMVSRLLQPEGEEDIKLSAEVVCVDERAEPGIRFIVMITGGDRGRLSEDQRDIFANDVLNLLLKIKGAKCLEVYRGSSDGWLIIDGRVDFGDYTSINQLKNLITETRVTTFGCRATTYLCCDNVNGVEEYEGLYVADDDDGVYTDEELIALLEGPESEAFETKGSLRMNMNQFFTDGTQAAIKIEKGKPDPILKTIAAFVNGEGGVLIVGALEEEIMAKRKLDVTSLPEYGEYRLSGVDADFMAQGFDKAHLYLKDIIRKNMSTGVWQLVEVRPLAVEGTTLMAVIVRKGAEKKPYLNEYYVRNGAETVPMTSLEIMEYAKLQSF